MMATPSRRVGARHRDASFPSQYSRALSREGVNGLSWGTNRSVSNSVMAATTRQRETIMTTIIAHEGQQVERANATGLQPVVFVHGLWLLPRSWDRWAAVFEEAGYTTLTPGWPDDPETVGEANANPELFAHKTVGQVADHFDALVRRPN